MKMIKKVLLFGILSLGTSSFALDADAIAKGGRTLLQNHGGADVIGVVSQSNENVKMPSRSALLEAVQQHRGAHLRGRQPSSLSQVHDLKSANNNLVVEDSSRLGVSKESQQLTDHIIIVSGGRTHFGVNHGDNRDLQVSLPAGLVPTGSNEGSSVEAATTDIPSDSPSMAPTEKCYSIDLSFETDGDAAALSFVMYNLLDLDDGVLNQTIIAAQYGSLQNNTVYSLTDPVCVEPGCYRAILFDNQGNGFDTSGLLIVSLDGVEVLNVQPGDDGIECGSCQVPGTVYYFAEFGDCVANDGATSAPTTLSPPEASCADLDLAFVTDTQEDGYVIVLLEADNFGNVLFSQNSFEAETAYGADESQICIAPGGCYEIYVFDDAGDGFEVGSGFTLDIDGETVMEVVANDLGTPCLDCDGDNVVFWSAQFGCTESAETSTTVPTVPAPPIALVNNTDAPEAEAGITVCMEFVLNFTSDSTPEQYSTIVFDLADLNDDDSIGNPLLSVTGSAFDANTPYSGVLGCLDPLSCYAFVFYDDGMDGLGAGGEVTATVDGSIILSLTAGDLRDFVPLDDGTSGFWLALFGNCA